MDPVLLLRGAQEVSLILSPDEPTKVRQREFDEARSQCAVPNIPRAKRIVEQLNAKRRTGRLKWAGVLALAHTPQENQTKTISTQETGVQTWLTEPQIIFALIFVARRLDTKALSKESYDHELHNMQKQGVDIDQLHLPSGHQITRATARKLRQQEQAFPLRVRVSQTPITKKSSATTKTTRGQTKAATSKPSTTPNATPKRARRKRQKISQENAWKAALVLAGLQQAERTYLPSPTVSTVELLEKCYAAHSIQLTRDEARAFVQANQIAYSEKRQKLNWGESIAQWKKDLQARGIVPPEGPPPRNQRPDYSRNAGRTRTGQTRRTGWADIDACLKDVRAYLTQLPAGERSTYAGLQRWMRAQNRIPPAHDTLRKHGGWLRVQRLAQEQMFPGLGGHEPKDDEKTPSQQSRWKASPSTVPEAAKPTANVLEPASIIKLLSFPLSPARSPKRKRTKSRIQDVQSAGGQPSKHPGKMPKSGSRA